MKFLKDMISNFKTKLEPKPEINLDDVHFLVRPEILVNNGKYVLRYQVATGDLPSLTRVLYHKKTPDKAYYFFGIPISHPESGTVVERELEIDGTVPYAEKNAIYWLNKGGTEIHLPVNQR